MKQARARDVRRLFRTRGTRAWLDMVERYGPTFRLQGAVVTADPELVRTILMMRPHTEHRSRAHRTVTRITPGSSGILFMEGEQWLRHLRALTPALLQRHIAHFPDFIRDSTMAAAQGWLASGEQPDLFLAITQLGVQHVLRIGYGLDPGHPLIEQLGRELAGYKLATMGADPRPRLDHFALGPAKVLDLPWTLRLLADLRGRTARIRRLAAHILADSSTRLSDEAGWVEGLEREHLPLAELADELNHMYGAYNAVDYVITAALLELSRHPEWVGRLRAGADVLDFMREVLRLYPVAMSIFRQTGEPIIVDGEELPAGTQVTALPYALHRRPDLWPNAETFDPDRWVACEPTPFSYIPFLEGPRKCIGRDLAEQEFQVVVSTLVHHFDLEVPDTSVDVLPFVIPRFDRPLPFRIRPCTEVS